ncbi:protein DBF4 homolog A-like isoform X3 [Scyliorhinus canicula]|uniref:protein DBF4 homolog A-like isoform X3 n=1 Tax=Scyliorhinus canicula TaxID=7830 RepID=UPI0018F71CE2|nr:protein DBF4 homolog A-like isoform X3 [Scyliorhinus canicula]
MKPRTKTADSKLLPNRLTVHGKSGRSKGPLKSLQRGVNKAADIKLKPFTGKVFYLDLPSSKHTENLEKDLQDLGGTIEKFLSKDINYIISNRSEAKFAQTTGKNSPVPSPDSVQNAGNTSPHLSSRKESHEGSSHRALEMVSRGKSFVKKVIKEQEFVPGNNILSNALAWGVRILYIDDVKAYIARRKEAFVNTKSVIVKGEKCNRNVQSNSHRTKGKLKKPFIKVEAISRHYRPLYIQLDCYPEINYYGPNPWSPFDIDKKNKANEKQNKGKASRSKGHKVTVSEKNCKMDTKIMETLKEKKKKGYCECCMMKYEDLKIHLKSEHHKKFSESTEFNVVDKIISQFDCDFVDFQRDKMKRTKCSIGVNTHDFTQISIAGVHEEFRRPHKEHVEGNRSAVIWSTKNNECVSGWENKPSSLSLQAKEIVSSGTLNSPSQMLPLSTPSHVSISEMLLLSTFVNNKSSGEGVINFENPKKDTTLHSLSLCQGEERSSIISKVCISEQLQLHHIGRLPIERSHSFAEESSRKNRFDEDMCGSRPQPDTTVCSDSDKSKSRLLKLSKNLQQKRKEQENTVLHIPKQSRITDHSTSDTAAAPVENPCSLLQPQVVFGQNRCEELMPEIITPSFNISAHKSTELSVIPQTVFTSSPCMKLHRKVRFSAVYGRNKKKAHDHRMEISTLAKERCLTEESEAPSLPLKNLLELFQTSEDSGSEFSGFTDHSSQKMSEVWDDDQPTNILSVFAQSSSLSSFLGF